MISLGSEVRAVVPYLGLGFVAMGWFVPHSWLGTLLLTVLSLIVVSLIVMDTRAGRRRRAAALEQGRRG